MRIVEVKRKTKTRIKKDKICNKQKLFIIAITLFIIGVLSGALYFNKLDQLEVENMTNNINNFFTNYKAQDITSVSNFMNNTGNNIKHTFVILISVVSIYFLPLIIGVLMYKGFVYGFSSAFFIKKFGFKGLGFLLASYIPSVLIYILATIILCVYTTRLVLKKYGLKKENENMDKEMLWNYCIIVFVTLLAIIIGTLIESFITPFILALII